MTWEMLQIVDIAFNNFSGKLPREYFTTWKRNIKGNKEEAGLKFIEKQITSFSGGLYYQDSITVISKGQKMELVKILTIFTSIDFSSNHFDGPIPEELMDWKELRVLNLSNNALSGKIPSSIGNMSQLESLDLSQNSEWRNSSAACKFVIPFIFKSLLQSFEGEDPNKYPTSIISSFFF